MALLERVATLVRANLNDLIDRAEDPEKLVKQVILDMENQLMQVKTQVAIAIADQHVLEKKRKEREDDAAQWMRRAELAVDKKQDDLARAALARSMSHRRMAENYGQQVGDQGAEVEHLKSALRKLEQKLAETRARGDLLITQHRRARARNRATGARAEVGIRPADATLRRVQDKVRQAEAIGAAGADLADHLDDQLAALEEQEEIERVLAEIKSRRGAG